MLLKYRAGIPSDRRYLATVRRLMWMPWFVRCSAISRSLIAFESVPDWSSNATASLAGAAAVCHRSITIERSLRVPRGVFTYLRQSARTITVLDIWVACIRYSTGTRDGWLDWLARYGVSEAMRASPSFASIAVRSAMASSIHRTLVTSVRTCFLASGSLRTDDTTIGSIASPQAGPGTEHWRAPVNESCSMTMSGTTMRVGPDVIRRAGSGSSTVRMCCNVAGSHSTPSFLRHARITPGDTER